MTSRKRILILGGYGNFGKRITQELARQEGLEILVGGRDVAKAAALADSLKQAAAEVKPCLIDINDGISTAIAALAPHIVVHTCGPFQGQGYDVARACIALGCDYVDLADGRDYVAQITQLDADAKAQNSRIISGASSVPALTAAVIDDYLPQFGEINEVVYGISTAQKTPPGLATAQGLLAYAGKPFNILKDGILHKVYGWQGLERHTIPGLGTRWLSHCDVPDLEIFPTRYPHLRHIRFLAGVEVKAQQGMLWLLSYLVRWGLIKSLSPLAAALMKIVPLFDFLGTASSGFFMHLHGKRGHGEPLDKFFYLVARQGHGPHLPVIPALIMVRRLLADRDSLPAGAMPCVGLMTLQEYMGSLGDLDVEIIRS